MNKKAMGEEDRVSMLARRAAQMESCIYAVYLRSDGTYGFGRYGTPDIEGDIVEFRHYL